MIKFGVLRTDADGISLIGLHFGEVRQRTLCWRTSGRTLGYSRLRQAGAALWLASLLSSRWSTSSGCCHDALEKLKMEVRRLSVDRAIYGPPNYGRLVLTKQELLEVF